MTSTLFTTVVIPTYNRAAELRRALDSVFGQTKKYYEVIVVDDGSTDDTADVVKKYGGLVQYIRQNNGGASSARNTGVRAARGDLIAFLDSDDEWLPLKLQVQCEVFEQRPDIDFVTCLVEGERLRTNSSYLMKSAKRQFLSSLVTPFPSNASRYIVRKHCFDQYGGFDLSLHGPEDWDFWLKLMRNGCRCHLVTQELVRYYNSPDALSGNPVEMLRGEAIIKQRYVDTLTSLWQRWWIGTCFQARSHFSAAITYRELGDRAKFRNHLLRSIISNPFYPRASDRLRSALKMLAAH